jgi:hypothetical protein
MVPAVRVCFGLVLDADLKKGSAEVDEFAVERFLVDVSQVRIYSDAG